MAKTEKEVLMLLSLKSPEGGEHQIKVFCSTEHSDG